MERQTNMKVFIRLKPPPSDIIFKDKTNQGLLHYGQKVFGCDGVFGTDCSNEEVFERVGRQLVQNTLEGYNSCLFAYGQTGTGKTLTMTGNVDQQGMVQMCFKELFERLNRNRHVESYSIKMTFLEIYNQNINDLMTGNKKDITVREKHKSSFDVQGMKIVAVQGQAQFQEEVTRCLMRRATHATLMNQSSSRSHSILTLLVEVKYAQEEDECLLVRKSKLHFIDLAGSQKQKKTQARGQRLKQANSINQSLLTLGRVVSNLAENSRKKNIFVPYRESVLTKILKDSLGGNSQNIFVGTISTKHEWLADTIGTIGFLGHAKKVKNEVQVNQMVESQVMKVELTAKKHETEMELEYPPTVLKNYQHLQETNHKLNGRMRAVMDENQALRDQVVQLEETVQERQLQIQDMANKIALLEMTQRTPKKNSNKISSVLSQLSQKSTPKVSQRISGRVSNVKSQEDSELFPSFFELMKYSEKELENAKKEEQMLGKVRATQQEHQETIRLLKEQVERLSEELTQKDQEQRELVDEIERLEETLEMRYEARPVEQKELHMLQTLNEEMEQKIQELQYWIESQFDHTIRDLYQERDDLYEDNEKNKAQNKGLVVQLQRLRLSYQDTIQEAREKDRMIEAMKAYQAEHQEELEELKEELQNENQLNLEAMNEQQKLSQEMVTIKQEAGSQIQRLTRYTEELEEQLKSQNEQLESYKRQKHHYLLSKDEILLKQFEEQFEKMRQLVLFSGSKPQAQLFESLRINFTKLLSASDGPQKQNMPRVMPYHQVKQEEELERATECLNEEVNRLKDQGKRLERELLATLKDRQAMVKRINQLEDESLQWRRECERLQSGENFEDMEVQQMSQASKVVHLQGKLHESERKLSQANSDRSRLAYQKMMVEADLRRHVGQLRQYQIQLRNHSQR